MIIAFCIAGAVAPGLQGQAENTYPHSEGGFAAQVKATRDAYCSGDASKGQQLLQQFELPDAKAWFAKNVDPKFALAERYEELVGKHNRWMAEEISWSCKANGSMVLIDYRTVENPERTHEDQKPTDVQPLAELALDHFGFETGPEGHQSARWVETFVYVDGAFRFVGIGEHPFWSWEENPAERMPKVKVTIEPARLIKHVQATYPKEARKAHIQGAVVIKAIVDKEGKLKNLRVISGDPLLRDSALKAAREWRYWPTMMGGQPVEV